MNDRLRIKRHYSVVAHSADVVELRWGVWSPSSFTVTDEARSGRLARILRRLDGTVPVPQIAKEEGISRSEIEIIIDQLVELGVMEKGAGNVLDHYLESYVPTMKSAGAAENRKRIVVFGDPELGSELRRTLSAALPEGEIGVLPPDDPGLQLLATHNSGWLFSGVEFYEKLSAFDAWAGSFVVHVTHSIHPLELQAFNRVALARGIPWLHAAIDGPFLIVGPTFAPKRSACYECFETRVAMNFRENASYVAYKTALAEARVHRGRSPAVGVLGSLLTSHAALEAINYNVVRTSFTVGKVLMIHVPTMELSFQEVLRVPGCAACGSLPERDDKELYFDVRSFLDHQEEPAIDGDGDGGAV